MKLFILDNNGETLDRYTIINEADGEMIGASENPFHGFGQYCGNVVDDFWCTCYGMRWREGCTPALIRKRTRFAISQFKKDCKHIGKPVKFDDLPEDVKKFINQSFN